MHNYIDYEWETGMKYRIFTFRRLFTDLYNLKHSSVLPVVLNFDGLHIVREVNEGSYIVEFDSYESYIKTFRGLDKNDAVMVRESDYSKLFKQYLTVVEQSDKEERLYAKPASGGVYYNGKDYAMRIDTYYTGGYYTMSIMNLAGFEYASRQDVYKLRDIWLSEQDSSFDYCKSQTETIDAIVEHLTDIHNTASGQLKLFKTIIDSNKKKGFGMCAYKVKYLDTHLTTKAFAKKPEDLFNGLLEEYKDKVSGVETIGFCLDNMENGKFYRVVFTNNTEFEFVFKGMKDFSRLISRHVQAGRPFRVEEVD